MMRTLEEKKDKHYRELTPHALFYYFISSFTQRLWLIQRALAIL